MEVAPGELCVYPGSLCAFDVTTGGIGHFLTEFDATRVEANDFAHGELTYDFLAVVSERVWIVQSVPPPKENYMYNERVFCPASQQVTDFVHAIRNTDIRRVREMLASGLNLTARTTGGFTLLGIALLEAHDGGSLEIVQMLIDAGANVNGYNSASGTTVLHTAASYGFSSAVEMLLSAGADPNARDVRGYPVLQRALNHEPSPEILEAIHALFDAGADMNTVDHEGRSLLFRALLFYDKEIVQAMIERGADIHALDRYGRPLLYPTLSGLPGGPEKTRLLVDEGADPDARDILGTPVLSLGLNSNWNEIEALLEAGADPNACDAQGNPPLVYAIRPSSAPDPKVDYIENVRLLVDAGADVNATVLGGDTILAFARRNSSPEIIEYLIDAGAE